MQLLAPCIKRKRVCFWHPPCNITASQYSPFKEIIKDFVLKIPVRWLKLYDWNISYNYWWYDPIPAEPYYTASSISWLHSTYPKYLHLLYWHQAICMFVVIQSILGALSITEFCRLYLQLILVLPEVCGYMCHTILCTMAT